MEYSKRIFRKQFNFKSKEKQIWIIECPLLHGNQFIFQSNFTEQIYLNVVNMA